MAKANEAYHKRDLYSEVTIALADPQKLAA
jgi:hypothetical protein